MRERAVVLDRYESTIIIRGFDPLRLLGEPEAELVTGTEPLRIDPVLPLDTPWEVELGKGTDPLRFGPVLPLDMSWEMELSDELLLWGNPALLVGSAGKPLVKPEPVFAVLRAFAASPSADGRSLEDSLMSGSIAGLMLSRLGAVSLIDLKSLACSPSSCFSVEISSACFSSADWSAATSSEEADIHRCDGQVPDLRDAAEDSHKYWYQPLQICATSVNRENHDGRRHLPFRNRKKPVLNG